MAFQKWTTSHFCVPPGGKSAVCCGRGAARHCDDAGWGAPTVGWLAHSRRCRPQSRKLPTVGVIGGIVLLVAFVLFALGLGWIGYVLWISKGEALRQTVLTS